MIDRSAHEALEQARALLGHEIPSGDLGEVVERVIHTLVAQLEKRRCAATSRPRRTRRETTSPRHIPASVKRNVWARDGARCTFVDDDGRRCPARGMLELDHIEPVARGGRATEENLRLRCRAHNAYEAERAFGAEFVEGKRREAAEAAKAHAHAAARATTANAAAAQAAATNAAAHVQAKVDEVIPYLRSLRFRPDECRRAAALCEEIPDAPLEERVRRALSYFRPRACTTFRPAGSRHAPVASPAA
jgi:5-methylcytosine-specific restriction endonuclease McrA